MKKTMFFMVSMVMLASSSWSHSARLVGFPSPDPSEWMVDGATEVLVCLQGAELATRAVRWDLPHAVEQWRQQVQSIQSEVIERVDPSDLQVQEQYHNLPIFAAEVTLKGLERLLADPQVVSIEPILWLHQHLRQGIGLIGGTEYRSEFLGEGVAIAIVDSGVDYTHPMLGDALFPNAKVIGGYDFGDSDDDPMAVGNAHGTACAGIAAGNIGEHGDYIGGVAPAAKIYALKVGADNSGAASTAKMIAAWDWCVTHQYDDPDNPILVISTSMGTLQKSSGYCDDLSPAMTLAAHTAIAAGMAMTVSSGNEGHCDGISWPSCISGVISVGAVYDASFGSQMVCLPQEACAPKRPTAWCDTEWYATDETAPDLVTAYSNYGLLLTVLAPSARAYTTDIAGADGYTDGDYIEGFGGTSASCPYVAGAIAVMQNAAYQLMGDYLSPQQVTQIITSSGDPVVDPRVEMTVSRLNLHSALQQIHDVSLTPVPSVTETPLPAETSTPTPSSFCMGDANRDGFVNGEDFRAVRDNFGNSQCGVGDANNDCFVNGEDFRVVRDYFGQPCH